MVSSTVLAAKSIEALLSTRAGYSVIDPVNVISLSPRELQSAFRCEVLNALAAIKDDPAVLVNDPNAMLPPE